jgi:hypothetical protein
METPLTALGVIAMGLAMFFFGAALIGEYRSLFRRNPKAVMSTEVSTLLAELGSAGQLAAFLIFAGAWIAVIGFFLLVLLAAAAVGH